MKTLILTCNTGEGHNSAAGALKDVLDLRGYQCDITDSLRFLSPKVSKFISQWHSRVYRYAPKAFGKGYSIAENHSSFMDKKSPIYRFLTAGMGKLHDFMLENGYDVVVCVHPFSALMLSKLVTKYKPDILTGFVATDYTCSPTVADSNMDVYFIPHHRLKDEFVSCGIPEEKLFASGIPVRRSFYHKIGKQDAKKALGLPTGKRNILMMCGSMGCGPLEKAADALSTSMPDDVILTVLCGKNEHLYRQLSKKTYDNVRFLSFTDKMSQLMDSAELYITKAGGLSVTEAAAKRLPLVLIDVVSGCETYNKNFFVDLSCAVSIGSADEFPYTVNSLLSDEKLLRSYSICMEKEFNQNSAEAICDYIEKARGC